MDIRNNLKNKNGERRTFVGTFKRFGMKSGYKGMLKTVLLTDVKLKNDDDILTDHLWFNFTKGFEKLDLNENDIVQFDARVKAYLKGYYKEYQYYDYKLSHPTKLKKI